MERTEITIIGIGMGSLKNLTVEAREAIEASDFLIGAKRMTREVSQGKKAYEAYKPAAICEAIRLEAGKKGAVLMSGDSGFFSGTKRLLQALEEAFAKGEVEVTVLPGISSLSYLCAKLHQSWEDVHIVNLHGKKENLYVAVRTNEKVFAITGTQPQQWLQKLKETGLGKVKVSAGENLSYEKERIRTGTVEELSKETFEPLTVFFFENPEYESRLMTGLSDECFLRGKVPMTKSEIRAITLSRLKIRKKDIVYDVGAGTGSVSVEMAFLADTVYAIETNPEALELIAQNKERFALQNLEIVEGMAPEALEELPVPDAAFIGGSKGNLRTIMEVLLQKNPGIRLVVNTVTIENMQEALQAAKSLGCVDIEGVQVQANRMKKAGNSHLLLAQNPIFILSCQGKGTL